MRGHIQHCRYCEVSKLRLRETHTVCTMQLLFAMIAGVVLVGVNGQSRMLMLHVSTITPNIYLQPSYRPLADRWIGRRGERRPLPNVARTVHLSALPLLVTA
jgi:hypothetical protein